MPKKDQTQDKGRAGDTRVQQAIGIRVASQIVTEYLLSGWQEIAAINDNAVDGAILLRKSGRDTGGIIFAQVKCGTAYRKDTKKRPNHIDVLLGREHIETHLPRWRAFPGPVILIYVDPSTDLALPHAWWCDLKSESSYPDGNKNVVIVPKKQRFYKHTKGDLLKLCGSGPSDRDLNTIMLDKIDISYLSIRNKIKTDAREFYKEWAASDDHERTHPTLGPITINRVGWRHICRKGRSTERIIQSCMILGAARKMITDVSKVDRLGRATIEPGADGQTKVFDYVGLRAKVVFPHRHQSVIQIVLRRFREFHPKDGLMKSKVWFYSVYELRRGRDV